MLVTEEENPERILPSPKSGLAEELPQLLEEAPFVMSM
jgi:hypothetical protein